MVIFKILLKIYELILVSIRKVDISFFIDSFESNPNPISTSVTSPRNVHVYIPFRNKEDLTQACLTNIFLQTPFGSKISVHLIDNGSCIESLNELRKFLEGQTRTDLVVDIQTIDIPFNFSKLCNAAISNQQALINDDYLLFLNNDVLLENPSSLRYMTRFMDQNSSVGALGITLLYPDRKIQHIFAAPGVKIIAAHPFKGKDSGYLLEWKKAARQVPAVTGACIMVTAKAFHQVGGFDENLPTAGQDIDLCLKLRAAGLSNWTLPMIEALHLESASRKGAKINGAEVEYIHKKWGTTLTQNTDYPLVISRWSEQPARRLFENSYPYQLIVKKNKMFKSANQAH